MKQHDLVALKENIEGGSMTWTAGEQGTIVGHIFPGHYLVQIEDEEGRLLDLVYLPEDKIELAQK